jgi:hypothetical protein
MVKMRSELELKSGFSLMMDPPVSISATVGLPYVDRHLLGVPEQFGILP